jgi:site-specific DNA-methyltransferase (adenine-specific)
MTNFKENAIYCGDCLSILKDFPKESINLIYLDPPFFTNRRYVMRARKGVWGELAFADEWPEGLGAYVNWIRERIMECNRVLKTSGSIYLHCDPHASHYLKVMMDDLFGLRNFRNEIVWQRQRSHNNGKQGATHFGRTHDTILFYVKSRRAKWNTTYVPYEDTYVKRAYKYCEERTGRKYAVGDITAPGGPAKGNPQFEFLGFTRYWRFTQERMEALHNEGRIVQLKPGGLPYLKRYLDEMKGICLQDIWCDVRSVHVSRESIGYPTQKPLSLLRRIIESSSQAGDLVLDPFCGCGTALSAAHETGRRWIGIDVNSTACMLVRERLRAQGANVSIVDLEDPHEEKQCLQVAQTAF